MKTTTLIFGILFIILGGCKGQDSNSKNTSSFNIIKSSNATPSTPNVPVSNPANVKIAASSTTNATTLNSPAINNYSVTGIANAAPSVANVPVGNTVDAKIAASSTTYATTLNSSAVNDYSVTGIANAPVVVTQSDIATFLQKVTIINSTSNSFEKSDKNSSYSALSGDGRFAIFITDDFSYHKIFRKELSTGNIQLVNSDSAGNLSTSVTIVMPQISFDGRYILYVATEEGIQRPFRKDMLTGKLENVLNGPEMKMAGFLSASMNDKGNKIVFSAYVNDGTRIYEKDFSTGLTTTLTGLRSYPVNFRYTKDENSFYFNDSGLLNGITTCPGNACAFYKYDILNKKIDLISKYNDQNPGFQYGGGMLSKDQMFMIYPLSDKDNNSADSKTTYRIKNLNTNLDLIVDSPDDTLFSAKFFGIQYQLNGMYGDDKIAIVNLNSPKMRTRFNGPVLILKDFKEKKYYNLSLRKLMPSLKASEETLSYFTLSADKSYILIDVILGAPGIGGSYVLWAKLDDLKIEISPTDLGIQ